MGRTHTSTTVLHSIFREKTSRASDDVSDKAFRSLVYYGHILILLYPFHCFSWFGAVRLAKRREYYKEGTGHWSLDVLDVQRGWSLLHWVRLYPYWHLLTIFTRKFQLVNPPYSWHIIHCACFIHFILTNVKLIKQQLFVCNVCINEKRFALNHSFFLKLNHLTF